MNVLIVGTGPAGSFLIRGEQLGRAIGARVTVAPTAADWAWAEVIVLVKRALEVYAPRAHETRRPVVWDALDFWRQPAENGLAAVDALALLRWLQQQYRPTLTIGATAAQATDAAGVYLPHHTWADLVPTPARATVSVVAYQGSPRYLGRWAERLHAECTRRGWRFVLNPPDLAAADLLVALRDEPWDGWMCRRWKSGVKLVNAIAAGRPVLMQPSAAADEIAGPGSLLDTAAELPAALERWADLAARTEAVVTCQRRAQAYTLPVIAAQYRETLCRL